MRDNNRKEYKLLCDSYGDIIKCDTKLLSDPLIAFNIFLLYELVLRLISVLNDIQITPEDIEEIEVKKYPKKLCIIIKRIIKDKNVFYDVTLRVSSLRS